MRFLHAPLHEPAGHEPPVPLLDAADDDTELVDVDAPPAPVLELAFVELTEEVETVLLEVALALEEVVPPVPPDELVDAEVVAVVVAEVPLDVEVLADEDPLAADAVAEDVAPV